MSRLSDKTPYRYVGLFLFAAAYRRTGGAGVFGGLPVRPCRASCQCVRAKLQDAAPPRKRQVRTWETYLVGEPSRLPAVSVTVLVVPLTTVVPLLTVVFVIVPTGAMPFVITVL